MLPRGARVLVALSGGADSVVLLHVLGTLQRRGHLAVAGVAHFNHQLRRAESDADEVFCRDVAAALQLPFLTAAADVRTLARKSGRSLEDAARVARYAFLTAAVAQVGADAVAVGHSLDDQAETFLLRLLRGAGPAGFAGIRPKAGLVIRPLLEVPRADLRAYAAQHQLEFREDASNTDTSIPRNRVRHQLIPVLQQYSPAIAGILAREAAIARVDDSFLDAAAIESARSIVLKQGADITIDAAALAALHPALGSRVARHAVDAVAPGRFVGYQHVEQLLELAVRGDGASVPLPGLSAVRRGGRIMFEAGAGERVAPFSNSFRFPLSIPGEVALAGWTVSADRIASAAAAPIPAARSHTALLAAAPLRGPLAVRSRRRGDTFRPLGMGGRGRKLQDYLVDRKIARADRDSLPLVVDGDDHIVWVVGQSIAEDFRVTAPERGVILLIARRLGGVG